MDAMTELMMKCILCMLSFLWRLISFSMNPTVVQLIALCEPVRYVHAGRLGELIRVG